MPDKISVYNPATHSYSEMELNEQLWLAVDEGKKIEKQLKEAKIDRPGEATNE